MNNNHNNSINRNYRAFSPNQNVKAHEPASNRTQAHEGASNSMQVNAGQHKMAQQSPVQDNAGQHRTMQDNAADTTQTPHDPTEHSEIYTISVPMIVAQLEEHDISKSEDTIQRYCREGDLDCEKLGKKQRYHATQASIDTLIATLKMDNDEADLQTSASSFTQAHEGAHTRMQDNADRVDVGKHEPTALHEAASTRMQAHEGVHTSNGDDLQVHAAAHTGMQDDTDEVYDQTSMNDPTSRRDDTSISASNNQDQSDSNSDLEEDEISTADNPEDDATKVANFAQDIFSHPYVKKLEQELKEARQDYKKQVEKTEKIQEKHGERLAQMHQHTMIAASNTYADTFKELSQNFEVTDPSGHREGEHDTSQEPLPNIYEQ